MNRTLSRAARTILQLIAAGGLTALVVALADGLAPNTKAVVLAAATVAVTLAQNLLESAGTLPTVFEPPSARAEPPA